MGANTLLPRDDRECGGIMAEKLRDRGSQRTPASMAAPANVAADGAATGAGGCGGVGYGTEFGGGLAYAGPGFVNRERPGARLRQA